MYSLGGITALSKQSWQTNTWNRVFFPGYMLDDLLCPVLTLREYKSCTESLRGSHSILFLGVLVHQQRQQQQLVITTNDILKVVDNYVLGGAEAPPKFSSPSITGWDIWIQLWWRWAKNDLFTWHCMLAYHWKRPFSWLRPAKQACQSTKTAQLNEHQLGY